MKITFISGNPRNIITPFAIYNYDEVLAGHANYIDIRKIIQDHSDRWLDEIHQSFASLSGKFLGFTRWWWVTGMSRLDARPWAQEYLFKPLFFARALLEWLSKHQDVKEVFLIGCPHEVAVYLKEFKKDLKMNGGRQEIFPASFIFFLLRHVSVAVLKLFVNAVHVARNHLFHAQNFVKSDTLALFQPVANASLASSCKYYYDGLFDALNITKNASIAYGCIDIVSPLKDLRPETDKSIFFILDNISVSGFIKSVGINIFLIFLTARISLGKNSCKVGEYQSLRFWPIYLLNELSRSFFLSQTCSYYALNSIFEKHRYQCVISTYEEKTIERTILFSCQEVGIPVIGYILHPQHCLALSLRNTHEPYAPKPDKYAVCGLKYIDYFQSWGRKSPDSITVWGSKKSSRSHLKAKQLSRKDLKVLVLISHPNELSVFHSWLCSQKRLTCGTRYFLRIYQATSSWKFLEELNSITSRFNLVEEIHGDFKEDADLCDLAVFCGTSAGLLAVNYGLISIHLCLDDFFKMNPCFNDVDSMLPCASATEFADCLDKVCALDPNSILEVYRRQRDFVDQVFSPVQGLNIERDIINVNRRSSGSTWPQLNEYLTKS